MESSTSSSPVTRIALLPVAVLLLFGLISQPVSATCYFPDGSTAEDGHKECSSGGTDATTCCADGMQCLTNGLCNDQRYEDWGRVLRGACTNRDFGGGCNDVCRDLWPQGDEAVWYCGSGQYCCSRLNDCCNDSKFEKYILGEPTVLATAGVSARPTRSWLIASQSSTSSATTTLSASPAPASNSSGGSSSGRTIGIAVGTVVGVLVLALIAAFFFIRRRRRASQRTEITHELAGGPSIPPPHTDPKSAYEFDDKRGGWITTGAARRKAPWRNRGARHNPTKSTTSTTGVLHEVQGERGVELPATAEAKEMYTPARGPGSPQSPQFDGDAGPIMRSPVLKSPVGSRRSRFVEVDVAGEEGIERMGSMHAHREQKSIDSFAERVKEGDKKE